MFHAILERNLNGIWSRYEQFIHSQCSMQTTTATAPDEHLSKQVSFEENNETNISLADEW